MICQNCGMQLPDDSEFCQYCGARILVQDEHMPPAVEIAQSGQDSIPELPPTVTVTGPLDAHENTGNADSETQNVTVSEKKEQKKWIAAVICLLILLLGMIGLNVYQYITAQDNVAKMAELSATIDKLNSVIGEKDTQIKDRDSTIAAMESVVSSLREDAGKYDTIVDAVRNGDLGYAANNFRSSESIIAVGRNEENRKFTLTANWSNGGTVSVSYDTRYPAAYVDFDRDSWTTSTKMTIAPNYTGVTVVTFSNDVNRQEFDVIIIVE